jgi:hypothetical protein
MPNPPKKRASFTIEDKIAIAKYASAHPATTHADLAQRFARKRSTVSKILKDRSKWLAMETAAGKNAHTAKRRRLREAKFPKLERALSIWAEDVLGHGGVLSDDLLKSKAQKLMPLLDISENEFRVSAGWLEKFKKRAGLSSRVTHGEAASAPLDTLPAARAQLQGILAQYDPADVYNADETALFYRMPPNRTLASGPVRGGRSDKTRVTLLFCVNATGTDRLKPLVIGKARRPRCFAGTDISRLPHIDYRANSNGWMTSEIFRSWLVGINARFRADNRNVLLLVDNCSAHRTNDLSLSNVDVRFLPPNTTAHLQPLDAGIIRAFKARYRAQLLAYVIEQFDAHGTVDFKIDLACTFRFIKAAWSQVTAESIVNCWHATGIAPKTAEPDTQGPADDPVTVVSESLGKLRDVIPNIMTAEEYLATDACVEVQPLLTDEELIAQATQEDAAVSDAQSGEGDLEVLQGPAPRWISGAKARTAIDDLLTFVEQNASELKDAEKHHEYLLAICDAVQKLAIRNAPQRRITDYFSMDP